MKIASPPLVREKRCSEMEVAANVAHNLEKLGFSPAGVDPLKDALVQVFARYCEILSERLNRVPESHHQAFLRMLGATPAPAVPAQVPLSFKAVKSAQSSTVVVPKFTQVSAPARNGSEAVIFETAKDLPLVQAELKQAVAVDPGRLVHADVSSMVTSAAGFTQPFLLADAIPLVRAMHISQRDIIGRSKLTRLQLTLELYHMAEMNWEYEVEWGIQSEADFVLLRIESDTTRGLTRSGEVILVPPEEWPSRTIEAKVLPWLTCRLRPNASPEFFPNKTKRYSRSITQIEITGYNRVTAVPPTGAFHGGVPLDVSRDFFPLGERPRFGEVFYILSDSFTVAGAQVIIDIKLTNPAGAIDSPIPAVSRKGNPRIRWEANTKRGWIALDCTDDTLSLTQDGEIELLMPGDTVATVINGVKGGWVRARLISGHYAADDTPGSQAGFPPMNPPSIAAIELTSGKQFGPMRPENLVIESNLEYHKIDPAQPFDPFPAPVEQGLTLYLGLDAGREASALTGRVVSLYAAMRNDGERIFWREGGADTTTPPLWQARTATGWRECTVSDSTEGLHAPGIIELEMPGDISGWRNSSLDPKQEFFWVRIVWDKVEGSRLPCLRRLSLNTVLASQTVRLQNELLGSSDGRPNQEFHALYTPIIGKLKLEVREAGGNASRGKVLQGGSRLGSGLKENPLPDFDSIKPIASSIKDIWIPWSEVSDFSSSDSHSRHYILDRLTGGIRFGDGKNGRIPPPGANNIRLHEYHTGGGSAGNQPAGTVTQLRTTIPYVESVTNPEPATGGQDEESLESLSQGAAARVRHCGRAVCMDDYSDLARKASPEVAYATCVPARDLQRDPMENRSKPGTVSVIVVPHGGEPRPRPSLELLKNIKTFLDLRRPAGLDLVLLGPEYVSIEVVAEIVWTADCSTTGAVAECEKRLSRFLHPVSGGPDGQGWQFGQRPHTSDFYPLLGAVEGLDHIHSLELRSEEERPGLLSAGTFLICSGKHEIRLC